MDSGINGSELSFMEAMIWARVSPSQANHQAQQSCT